MLIMFPSLCQDNLNEQLVQDDESLPHQTTLNVHRSAPSGAHSYCDVCKKSFTTEELLNVHQRMHSDEWPDLCNKSFSRSNLRYHQSLHSEVRPFSCDVCNKLFILQSDLRNHQLSHSGEGTFVSDVYNTRKSCSRWSNLRYQIRHTEVQPFPCDVCNK
jgi:uncharacterized Zn-finger protein